MIQRIQDLQRSDVTDMSTITGPKMSTSIRCNTIYIGTHQFEPPDAVTFTSRGIRIVAPLVNDPKSTRVLNIHTDNEVVKVIAHFSSTHTSLVCVYVFSFCAEYIRKTLNIRDNDCGKNATSSFLNFSSTGQQELQKIVMVFDSTPEVSDYIRSVFTFVDEITLSDAQQMLQHIKEGQSLLNARNAVDGSSNSVSCGTNSGDPSGAIKLSHDDIRQLLIYPPGKGGIPINTEDYLCLATAKYLNDIIIDFYLKWIHNNIIPTKEDREKTFMFSTFFYKRLTTMTTYPHHDKEVKEVKQTAAQKRHARVQNWTKNVNLFEKDFIIIPINEQSHWFLAIICFPRLTGPVTFDTNVPVDPNEIKKQSNMQSEDSSDFDTMGSSGTTIGTEGGGAIKNSNLEPTTIPNSKNDAASSSDVGAGAGGNISHSNTGTTPGSSDTNNIDKRNAHFRAIKQPLILIFDSLAGASRSRVVATLRDYLTCEYKSKMPASSPQRVFTKDNMPGHCVKVPQQNNFTDCGLFLLQYVEQFYIDPIKDYRIPIVQLSNWFDTITVTRKREEISDLLKRLINDSLDTNGTQQKYILPDIPFPTLNGELVEQPDNIAEFEEDVLDLENHTEDMEELERLARDTSSEDVNEDMTSSNPSSVALANANCSGATITIAPKLGKKKNCPETTCIK